MRFSFVAKQWACGQVQSCCSEKHGALVLPGRLPENAFGLERAAENAPLVQTFFSAFPGTVVFGGVCLNHFGYPRMLIKSSFHCRMVYKYFYGIHLLSGFLSVTGYCMLLFGLFGLNLLFFVDPKTWFDAGLHLLFYGFYYGVIGKYGFRSEFDFNIR